MMRTFGDRHLQHSPRCRRTKQAQNPYRPFMLLMCKAFVRAFVKTSAMLEGDLPITHAFTDVVVPYVDMLGSLMPLGRESECDSRGIVAVEDGGERLVESDLPQKRVHP